MKKSGLLAAAAVLAVCGSVPAPVLAEGGLSDRQVDLYSEMLAMSIACREISGIRIRQDEMHDWMTAELAGGPESDVDRVLEMRDTKLTDMQARTAEVNALPHGNRRDDAVNEHYASSLQRCMRMSRHSVAGEFFTRP